MFLGCVMKEVLEDEENLPLKISFKASGGLTNPTSIDVTESYQLS